ncbi:hypothetical protein [Knoellia koreensis]|uniref:Uncharacterized protein n=1 Tax=Knoellia koreensis TaxID=2730921 RepID=A0A849HK69_9MICO|nr:hypothetical protein [Knoellia sp. DB2414S]NNM46731.1 hypothetical protein [Knoellia sp. DB2414S]
MSRTATLLRRLRRAEWAVSLVASLGLAYLLLLGSPPGRRDLVIGLLALGMVLVCVGALLKPDRGDERPRHPTGLWDVIGPLFFPAQLLFHGSERDWRYGLAGGVTLAAAILLQIASSRAVRRPSVEAPSNA